MDLVEFLRARLDRDERIARDCTGHAWRAAPSGRVEANPEPGAGEPVAVARAETDAYAEHIARHHPSRTLAEVAARRRIVDDYEKQAWVLDQGHRSPEAEAAQAVRENVLRLLALSYATHPAYQQEWRP
ncbi:DUF6221 family protein [Actinomadura syzygii]|uniref:Uncharacterized protein n=1 Tax=Actinomadura syzygii TaxID=1427538 RepID=A0A5D0UGS0_9ACTN|nr:DUF6221 family protein [Actinomadura syzygii]TYC17701.1 hypothetical protein FXF65_06905 [Actinomadura syzygii]